MKIEDIKVGTPVIYWGIVKQNGEKYDPLKTVIASEMWELGNLEKVCKVVGKSSGVAITHLEKITVGSLIAAKIKGLAEISDEDIKSATENFFKDKGVNVAISSPNVKKSTF